MKKKSLISAMFVYFSESFFLPCGVKFFQRIVLPLFLCVFVQQGRAQNKVIARNIDTSLTISNKKSVLVNDTKKAHNDQQYPITISKKAGEAQVLHDEHYFLTEIKRIQSHISAIDHKVSVVSNDPVEKERAEKDGWFDQMNSIKKDLLVQKQQFSNLLYHLEN